MSITIATQTRRYTVKTDEHECEKLFDEIVMELIGAEPVQSPAPLAEVEEPVEAPDPVVIEPEKVEIPVPGPIVIKPDIEQYGEEERRVYSGFLYIRCDKCGEYRAFCSKQNITSYRCQKCGHKTELHDLEPLHMDCECGLKSKYMTNSDESAFDVNCIECGSPVSVKHNNKKGLFETIV